MSILKFKIVKKFTTPMLSESDDIYGTTHKEFNTVNAVIDELIKLDRVFDLITVDGLFETMAFLKIEEITRARIVKDTIATCGLRLDNQLVGMFTNTALDKRVVYTAHEIEEILTSHPRYDKRLKEYQEIKASQEKAILKKQKENKFINTQNQYQQYLILKKKLDSGVFDDVKDSNIVT